MTTLDVAAQRVLLEVVARRFYRMRTLEGFNDVEIAGHRLLCASYMHDGPRRHLVPDRHVAPFLALVVGRADERRLGGRQTDEPSGDRRFPHALRAETGNALRHANAAGPGSSFGFSSLTAFD